MFFIFRRKKRFLFVLMTLFMSFVMLVACGPNDVKDSYNLAVEESEGGSTDPEAGNHSIEQDSSVTLKAIANEDEGWQFVNWEGDVPEDARLNSSTRLHMNKDKTVKAIFSKSTQDDGQEDDGQEDDGQELSTPDGISIDAGDGEVILDWDPVEYADGYYIKYGISSGTYSEKIDVRNTTTYTVPDLTNDTTYYFVVLAYNDEGQSDKSNEVTATPMFDSLKIQIASSTGIGGSDPQDVRIPLDFIAVPSEGINKVDLEITFDNDLIDIIEIPEEEIEYSVDYSIDQGSISLSFEEENNLILEDGIFAIIDFEIIPKTTYDSANFGETEITIDNYNITTANSNSVIPVEVINGSINITDPNILTVPDAPELKSAEAGDGEVTLTWEPSVYSRGYCVYWGTDRKLTKLKDVGEVNTFTVSGLTNGTTYYFAVEGYNGEGSGEKSNQLSATPCNPGK